MEGRMLPGCTLENFKEANIIPPGPVSESTVVLSM